MGFQVYAASLLLLGSPELLIPSHLSPLLPLESPGLLVPTLCCISVTSANTREFTVTVPLHCTPSLTDSHIQEQILMYTIGTTEKHDKVQSIVRSVGTLLTVLKLYCSAKGFRDMLFNKQTRDKTIFQSTAVLLNLQKV